MKKKFFFIIISVFAMIGITIYMGVNLQKGSLKSFTKSGYILNSSTENDNEKKEEENNTTKYYFGVDTTYKNSFDNNVEFKDTSGKKVKVPEASFIHYEDDSIGLLKKGVILNLDNIKDTVPIYYNLFEGTILEYNNGSYIVDNLGKELKFKNFIIRVDENKYLLISDNIKLNLDDNTSTTVKSNYVEISVVEEGIIRIENEDASYNTVSTDANIGLSDGLSLNLDNGYFFFNDEPIINLNSMLIDSDDNVDITPIEEVKDKIQKEKEALEAEQNAQNGNNNNSNNNTGGATDGGAGDVAGGGEQTGTEFIGSETEVVENELQLPTAQVSDVEISANMFQGEITINDPDSIVTGTTYTTIVENSTNRVVFEKETDAGIYSIDVFCESLEPETNYSLITNVHYEKNDIEYTMDVVQQLFVTSSIGISIDKDYYTANELSFNVKIDDYSKVKSADVKLLSSTGEVLDTQPITDATAKVDEGLKVLFTGLSSNTKYTVVVDNILYEDTVVSDEYSLEISAKTLKVRPSMGTPSFSINKKDGLFTLKMNNMVDENNGVEKYIYEVYDARTLGDNPQPIVSIEKSSLSSIDLRVDDSSIQRGVPYTYKVIALFYDNEKYIEYTTGYSNNMQMDGVESPTISWTTDEDKGGITFEAINGFITITDPKGTIDYDKPITIVYTNSIGTTKSFTATAGNSIIPFNQNNLRANETYTISLYATVDLMDNNPAIDSYHIGSVIVKTNPTKPIEVFYNVDTESVTEAFKVESKLLNVDGADNTLEASTLSELTFLLYDGPNTNGQVVKRIRKVDRDEREYFSTLKEEYYDKSFNITPAFFNIDGNDLSSEYYTIQIVDAKDYTDFKNDIPLKNSTVTVQVNGFVDDPDPNSKAWFSNTLIRNKDAGTYDKYDSNLDAETIVGIKVNANYDNTKKYGVSLTYHVWDCTDSNNVFEVKEARKTVNFKSDGTIDPVYYWFGYGTDKDTDDSVDGELRRGHVYYFSFVGALDLNNDGDAETRYPTTPTSILRSDDFNIYKQSPNIKMYPSDSTTNSLTIKYTLKDLDYALDDGSLTALLKDGSDNQIGKNVQKVEETNSYKELKFSNFGTDGYLTIYANVATIKGKTPNQIDYINQYFDNVYTLPSISYSLMVDVNRILISINNYQSLGEAISHIAGLKLTFTSDGKSIVKDFVKLNGDNAVVDMYDLAEFLGKPVTLKVEAYYDNDLIGWDTTTDYVALQSVKDIYGGGQYYTLNSSNYLVENESARGSIYSVEKTNDNYVLSLQDTEYSYKMSTIPEQGGIKDNGVYFNLKKLVKKELTTSDNTFTFHKIIPGISLENDDGTLNISAAIQSVSFKADVYGFGSSTIKDSKIYVQISKTDDTGSFLEPEGDPHEFTLDQVNAGPCEINGLEPKQNYAMEFYAYIDNGQGDFEYTKLYDLDDNSNTRIYYFKTLSSIGITDISVVYSASSYDEKNLYISYNLDRIMGFDKIEYKLYKVISNGETGDVSLEDSQIEISPDVGFKNNMVKSIPCPPGSGFDFGGVYFLTITPYVKSTIGDTTEWIALDETIGEYRFNLRKLRNPYIGVTASIYKGASVTGNALEFMTTVFDNDYIIVDDEYTVEIQELDGSGQEVNDVTPNEYKGVSFKASNTRKSFIVDNLTEGKTYQFSITYYVDNKNDTSSVQKVFKYKAKALNENSISVGNISAVANNTNRNRIDLNFSNSYRITNIQSLRYSIYNSLDGTSYDNDIEFKVRSKSVNGNTIYYITLPEPLATEGIYIIQLQFIADDVVVDEQTIDYSYFM